MSEIRVPTLQRIPRGVWILGIVSLLMDVSSEMVHSLLPLFLVGSLGASALTVGIIEGLAESVALIVKIFSGVLTDAIGRRKSLAVFGYSLSAFTKPLFALAPTASLVLAARVTDRIGKGIRGAPRDALVADITPPEIRGAAFGLRQSLDTVGAFLGPLLAVLLMSWSADNFRTVFKFAALPAVAAVALLLFGLREPEQKQKSQSTNPLQRNNLRKLSRQYWTVVAIGTLFTLARFSEAFLILKGRESGISATLTPLILVVMNIVYSATAYPFGKLSDQISHTRLLTAGLIILLISDLVLAIGTHPIFFLAGISLWGVHMGMTQGLLSAMVAQTAPSDLRGTAFGFFNLCCGVAMLIASVLAGLLWDYAGPSVTFYAGAGFCTLSLIFQIYFQSSSTRKIH